MSRKRAFEQTTGACGEWCAEPHGNTIALYAGRNEVLGNVGCIPIRGHGFRLMNLEDGDSDFEANVARIVASVNICLGIPTEQLAALDASEVRAALTVLIMKGHDDNVSEDHA